MKEAERFRRWWKNDTPGFELCTLQQAVDAYCSTYPGRIRRLLVELLRTPEDPADEDGPPPGPRPFMTGQ